VESQRRQPGKEERQLKQLLPLRWYPERHCRQVEELQERQLGSKQRRQLFPLRKKPLEQRSHTVLERQKSQPERVV
jgi:hypothetical protein